MSDSTIGIKLADGSYYPIIADDAVGKKRLVLTTAKENQQSVQIDLYKGAGESLLEAMYIGSLVIENITPKEAGNAEIDFVLGIDKEGLLSARAGDKESGEHQNFTVSLDTLSPQAQYDLPDLEMEDFAGPEVVSEEEEQGGFESAGISTEPSYNEEEEEEEPRPAKRKPFFLIAFVVIALLIIGVIALLIFRSCRGEDIKPLEAGQTTPLAVTAPAEPVQPPAAAQQPAPAPEAAQQTTPQPPAQPQQPAPQAAPQQQAPPQTQPPTSAWAANPEGVWYKIVWGDTLWDISIAFYRTPWLYGKIAKFNSIKNPDLIYAGSRIFIPKE